MARVDILPATLAHVQALLPDILAEDRAEWWASSLSDPKEALPLALKRSEIARAGFIDGQIAALYGVVRAGFLTSHGIPWLIAGRHALNHPASFLRATGRAAPEIVQGFDYLENYVDARNRRAVRWLSWLGFKIDPPRPWGALGLDFHRFHIERPHV